VLGTRAATEPAPVRPAPAQRGYRWPAEWEPHTATWLTWPHNPDTWPGHLEDARREFAVFVRELSQRETVRLLVEDAASEAQATRELATAGVGAERVEPLRIPTDDSWIRDYGPVFLSRRASAGGSELCLADFGFDCWGGKYEPYDRDAAVPAEVQKLSGLPRFEADFVLEAGSIDGNGEGTLLTTESCLLNPNRGPGRSKAAMEERLGSWLGVECVIWLGAGIEGDDTDGHVDDVARFVDATTVVAAASEDASDVDAARLAENLRRLRAAQDARGRALSVVTLPMPPPHRVDGERCPASYANFYLANGCALVPTFGVDSDTRALAILRELLPDRDVVGVPCVHLVQGLGALHCLSQQQPL